MIIIDPYDMETSKFVFSIICLDKIGFLNLYVPIAEQIHMSYNWM